MKRSIFYLPSSILVLVLLAGCTTQTGPDSHTEVFKTPEQAAAARRDKLRADWQDMAVKINNSDRPDAKTHKHPTQAFALLVQADGVERTIDLSPLAEKMTGAMGKEREPIRALLSREMAAMDRDRLMKMGFDQVKALLYPTLANGKQLQGMWANGATEAPISVRLVIDLNWVPVVRWPGGEAQTAVDPSVAKAWVVNESLVCDAAIGNLKRDFISAGMKQPIYDTVDLPGLGRYGTLRSGMDAGFVLLPEFLTGVRRAWNMEDDLVIFLPSRTSVTFIERKNEKLLDKMIPEWSKLYGKVSEPLLGTMVLSGEKGLTLLSYKPGGTAATKPATGPATKPRVYIVN